MTTPQVSSIPIRQSEALGPMNTTGAIRKLPPFLCDMLAAPPRAGEGVHTRLFRVARQLPANLPAGEIVKVLENRIVNCGRHVSRTEIVAAVQNSLPCAWQPSGHPNSIKTRCKMAYRESRAT